MASPFLFFPDDRLTRTELSAACLDGHLVALGEGFMPADAVESTWMRAASLRPLVGDDLAATHLSAAWVHGALDLEPPRHDLQRTAARRLHETGGRRYRYRDVRLSPSDVALIGGVRVSTVARTLADLARSDDGAHRHVAGRWSQLDDVAARQALAWLWSNSRFPGSRRAVALLGATTT